MFEAQSKFIHSSPGGTFIATLGQWTFLCTMILYNVTVNVDEAIAAEWVNWMKGHHMPEVMATGCFEDSRIFRLLSAEEQGGLTYAVQYFAASMEDYERYQENYAAALQADHINRYKDRFVAFRTLLETV